VLSAREGQTRRAEIATQRAELLEPQLAYLTITIAAPTPTPGLVVERDGRVAPASGFATAIPIDPGAHVVDAHAAGYAPWRFELTVDVAGKHVVEIPALEKLADPVAPDEPRPLAPPPDNAVVTDTPPPAPRTKRLVGITAVGLGAASLITGSVFGLAARSNWNDAFDSGHCDEATNRCDADGQAQTDDARTQATLATVFVATGVALAATGTYLWWTATPADTLRVTPGTANSPAGLTLSGSF
jgi:hypothetical protein